MPLYTNVFGGTVLAPSQIGYNLLAIAVSTVLQWPIEQQITGGNVAAPIIDVNASIGGLSITCPDAVLVSPGSSITWNNIGANTVTILSNTGSTILSLAPGQAWVTYLTDNTTHGGTWRIFQLGAGTSTTNAAALAGYGLQAIGATLNQNMPIFARAVSYTVLVGDQAKLLIWTGGVGVFTLPDPTVAGPNWFVAVKNLGSGTLTLTPAVGNIDSAGTKILNSLDSAFISCDGSQYFTVGFGRAATTNFNFVTISVAGGSNYTLTGGQLNQIAYRFTGLLTANIQVIVPASVQQYWIDNQTTGAFTLSIGTSGQASPPIIPQGNRNICYCDGTNVFAAVTGTVVYPIMPVNGGTGLTTIAAGDILYGSASNVISRLAGIIDPATLGWTIPAASSGTAALTMLGSIKPSGARVYAGASSVDNSYLFMGGSLSGQASIAPSVGIISPFLISIGSDTVDTTTLNGGFAARSNLRAFAVNFGIQPNHTGGRSAIYGAVQVVGAPAVSPSGLPGYVGGEFLGFVNANLTGATGAFANYQGSIYGINPTALLGANATFLAVANASEFDVGVQYGASVALKFGFNVIKLQQDVSQGVFSDQAIAIIDQPGYVGQNIPAAGTIAGRSYVIKTVGTSDFTLIGSPTNNVGQFFTATGPGSGTGVVNGELPPWNYGVSLGGYSSQWPFNGTSTIIGAQQRVVGIPAAMVATAMQANGGYKIATVGTTDYTSFGSLDNAVGTVFIATGPATGTGTVTRGQNIANYGIDFRSVLFKTAAFASPGFSIDPVGNAIVNSLFGIYDIRGYGAVVDGVTDDSAAVNRAIAAAVAAGGGAVAFPPGKVCAAASSITLKSNVRLLGYGATLKYTGAGIAIASPTTDSLNYSEISGLIVDGGSAATTLLSVLSGYNCYFEDLQFFSDSLTNTVIALGTNTTGTVDPLGGYNTVQCSFKNIQSGYNGSGKGCGTFISFNGTDASHVVTDNTFINCQAQRCNVYGINFMQWCDSNTFPGMTRIGLNGNVVTANGIGMAVATTGAGVYSETFEMFAVDTFGAPTTDNRQGIVATYGNSPKALNIQAFEYGPLTGLGAINVPSLLSGTITLAPRLGTNSQSIYMLGANIGIGVAPVPAIMVQVGINSGMTGVAQALFNAQGSCYSTASALGASYQCQLGAAASGSPYTVAQVMGFYAATGLNGANATTTNVYGFFCADQTTGSVNNYGYYSNISAGAGKFAFYGAGTADSRLGGSLGINGNVAPAQPTGYGTPLSPVVQGSFDPATVTLVNLAREVSQLVKDLKSYGVLGA